MSGSLNEVSLIGNLTRDPETRSAQDGKKIVNLTIATSESWKGRDGEKKERVEYHRCVIFSEGLAGVAESYLKKGSKCFLRGSLQTRKWTDQAGVEKYSTEVVVQGFGGMLILLGDPKGEKQQSSKASASSPAGDLLDDDAPF